MVTLGDVRGKGVGAAARAIMAKYLVRAILAAQRWPLLPGEALRDIHNALLAVPHEPHDFVTVCIASVDARSGVVGLATAGHPSPIALRHDRIERPLLFGNPALGVTEEAELQALPTDYVELAPGEALLLYTDGLSDVRDASGRYYEDARLDQALEELRDLPGARAPRGPDRRRHRVRRPPAGRRRRPRSHPPRQGADRRAGAALTTARNEGLQHSGKRADIGDTWQSYGVSTGGTPWTGAAL